MTRATLFALALAACGDGTDTDAGVDAGTIEIDAGNDEDAGRDAGMDGGMDAGTIAIDGGNDAGMSMFDAGSIGTCVSAPIEVLPTCPTFVPCGGELSGSWCYTGVCIEEREFQEAASPCPVTLRDFSGSIVGRVEFLSGMMLHRQTSAHVEGTIVVPSLCLLGGSTCADIQMTAQDALGPDAMVVCNPNASGGCDCDVVLDSNVDTTDTYSTLGTRITTGSGASERTFDYCVDPGVSLRFRETTSGGAEPGVQSTAPET